MMNAQELQQSQLSEIVFVSSCGNTFAIAEGNLCAANKASMIQAIIGGGLDTALLIETVSAEKFIMHVIEKDGSISNFCGNGAKAVGAYLVDKDKIENNLNSRCFIGNGDRYCLVSATVDYACVYIPEICVESKDGLVYVMNEPHRINFEIFDEYKSTIVYGQEFNESFVNQMHEDYYSIVTWERGVNGFTKSCGSACIATASILINMAINKKETSALYFMCPGGTNRVEFQDGHYILSGTVEFL